MARLTITVEGEVDEVRETLRRLVNGELGEGSATGSSSSHVRQLAGDATPTTASELQLAWTDDELDRLWAQLTDAARRVLAEVATHPDGYRFGDLTRALDMDMRRIGGSLSSVGHAMRRLYRVGDSYSKPWPIDGHKGVYRMDEGVAAHIRELATQSGVSDAAARREEG